MLEVRLIHSCDYFQILLLLPVFESFKIKFEFQDQKKKDFQKQGLRVCDTLP